IYVPIKEDNDHWYLMVMCLKLKTTFHLDSNLPAERKEARTSFIENLAVVLSDIITSSHFGDCPFEHADFSGGWSTRTIDVVDNVQLLPKNKDNSAIWVLSWLHMEYLFNSEIPPTISEHQVLVTTTIDLVLGASNKLRRTVMENASEHWVRLSHP
ncbi:hypothetical protein PIB30_105589, partial [Stylosanthes scabra]|nr:hypothetical protein [Stylosanthes scabra]